MPPTTTPQKNFLRLHIYSICPKIRTVTLYDFICLDIQDDIQCSVQFQSNSSELDTEVVEVLWSFLNTLTWLMIQMRFSPSFPPGEGSDWCQQISSDKQGGRRVAAKMPGFGIPFITRTMAGNSPHHGRCVQPFL